MISHPTLVHVHVILGFAILLDNNFDHMQGWQLSIYLSNLVGIKPIVLLC